MSREVERPVIVIDNGSGEIKAGFCKEDLPDIVIPSIVGHSRNKDGNYYIGTDILSKRDEYSLKYPIDGTICNWEDVEKLWLHLFRHELRVDSSEHGVLMIEPSISSPNSREKITQIMFETFNVPYFYLNKQELLSLFSAGRTAGLVVNFGESAVNIIPIMQQGVISTDKARRSLIAGRNLTYLMMDILKQKGYDLPKKGGFAIAQELKEKYCYVTQDYNKEKDKIISLKIQHELSDGKNISIDSERYHVTEALFETNILQMELPGIHEIINDTILSCDHNQHQILYQNIVLCGGSSMFPGLQQRLDKEINLLVDKNKNYKIKIIAPHDRKYCAWKGGSTFASLPTFKQQAISLDDYNEYGPSIVHRKCP